MRHWVFIGCLFGASIAEASTLVEALSTENVVGAPSFLGVERVVYSVERAGRVDVMIRDATVDRVYRYASHPLDDRAPRFSPNGESVAWVAQRDDVKGDLFIGGLPTDRRPRRVTNAEQGVESFAWGNDSQSILYITRDPFLDSRKGYLYRLESKRTQSLEMSVSRAVAGCSDNDWLVADDSRETTTFLTFRPGGSGPVPLVRLDGVLNEIVGFKCEGQIQEFYLSIFDSRARRSQTNVGLALLSVNWETGVSQVEYLIGENLPRFALSRLGNNVVGRLSQDAREFSVLSYSEARQFSVSKVDLSMLGQLSERERLNVIDAKEGADVLSKEVGSFYRFLSLREAKRVADASRELDTLWQSGCAQAYTLAGIYLQRETTEERESCTKPKTWLSRLAFARADHLMFRGDIDQATVGFETWASLESAPFLRFVGLTRWASMIQWISPIDAILQVIEVTRNLGLELTELEKNWFFDSLQENFRTMRTDEYQALLLEWPALGRSGHVVRALTLMSEARGFAAAQAWSQAFAASTQASKEYESPTGSFSREMEVAQWMLQSGQPRRALGMLQDLERRYPRRGEALGSLRLSLRESLDKGAMAAKQRGDAKAAYALYSQLLILEPSDLELTREMLRQAGPAGFLEQKIAGYAANLELETRGWLDHYLYALALTFAGADSLVDAERELRKARELQPQSVDVARTLSWVLLNREPQAMDALPRAEEVVELIERQLSRMSEDTVGYRELEYSLSLALFRLRKFDRAESILKRFDSDFDEVSSGRSAYLSLRADLAYRNGDNESAIVWLEQLLAAEETTGREDRLGELYARLGVVLYAAGKVDRALKVLSDSALRYAQSGGTQKANHLKRTVALLRNQPVWDKTQTGRQLEAWKWGLSGVERILFIASSRAAEAQALAVEPTTAGDEDEDATTAADLETTSPKGATISPYGDEEHWHKWSYATVSYNRGEQTFDLVEMSASIIDRVGVLESIWNQGVLEFGYVREVRDVLFDSLARLSIQSDPKVVSALERLMKQVPQEVRLTRAWKNLSEEFEAFILRDLTGALELCGLIPYLTLSETTTLAHACDFKAMAQRDVASLDDELKRIDQFLERAPRAPAEQSCSSDVFYQNWRARGALPSDAAALRRFLDDCPSIDAWQRTSLLIAFESVALGGAARGQAISISPQEPSEALIWALDEELIYLGGIETEEGWWFLEIGDGQTKIRRITSEKLLERLKYWRPRNPVLSSSLARLTNRLEPTSWSFVQSFLSFWEKETWEGPKFIAVPESLISLDKCNEVRAKPLRYETLRVNILKGDSLSEKLLDVERCARGAVKFHRLSVNYSSPGTIKDSDFDRIVYLLHQRHRFPFESAQLVAGDYVLNLGPKPTRGIAWIAVWNEYFQPLFANALSARRVQQSKGDQDSHRALVEEIEKLLNVFQGLRLTQPELLDGYIKNADGRAGMLGQVYPKLELFRSQFLTWAIASYEALGDISAASDILRTLLAERAWQGDLDKFRLWSRKLASFFIALEDTEQALNVLENCWAAEVADCGVQLGQVYLSEARYRDAERIADGLVGIADNARANVEGTNMLARIAEQERYDFDAAVELLLRAYAMANNVDLDLRVSLSINLMRVARLAGDYQAAETLGDSVAKWELTPSQRLRIELTRAQTWYVSGQARKVVRAMAKLTNLADDMDDTFGKMLCTSLWALSSLEVGRYDDARRLAESALSQAESLGNRREIANQLNNLGLVYARLGLHEKASQALNAAMTSDFTGRDSMSLAYSMRNLGQQKYLAGLHTQASGLLEESAYLSRKAGDRINEVRARFSFLLNQERLGVEELGERFWRLSEEAGSLRLVEIQWRALFGAYRSLEPSLNPEQALRILEEAFSISMSHIGLASERLGPGREALRNEYHFRLIKADKHLDAIKVALRFAQPASLRKGGKPLSLEGVQERLAESEALWYGWFDERGWQGWLIERDSQVFLGTEWDGDETLKIFADLEKRFKEYTPLGRSLEQLSKAFSYLLKDHLGEITTLKILDLETDLWIPYRALTVNGMLLDEQVRLEWVLPVLSSRAESPEALTYVVSEEESPHDLAFAMLEKSWLGSRLAATEIKQRDIFAPTLTQSHFHLTGHYNGLGKLEDLWFRQEGDGQTIYWPRRIFINTCGPAGESTRVAERYGALLTALSNGTDLALTHRLRISDWAASIISKRYYQTDTSEPVSERAREATRYVRRMFEHPAHWAGFEVITGL